MSIDEAKSQLKTIVQGNPDVNGVGRTTIDGETCLRVNLVDGTGQGQVPGEVGGYKVVTRTIGAVTSS